MLRIRIIVYIPELWRLKMEPWRARDAHNWDALVRIGPWRVLYCRPVVADSYGFDEEERDPHPDLHQSEKSDPDPHQSEKGDPDPQHCLRAYFCTFFIFNITLNQNWSRQHALIFPRCLEVWGGGGGVQWWWLVGVPLPPLWVEVAKLMHK